MAENNFNSVVDSLVKGLDGFAEAKTVVGDPIRVDDTIILPLVDITLGMAAGAGLNAEKRTNNGGGGMGVKMTPCAVLIIHDGMTRLVNVRNQDVLNKVIDVVPDVVSRIKAKKNGDPTRTADVEKAVNDAVRDAEKADDKKKEDSGKETK